MLCRQTEQQEGLSTAVELDDFTRRCVRAWKQEVGVKTQLVPGRQVRKVRRMGLNLCFCFTGWVGRKRARTENWWKTGRNRSYVAKNLGFRLELRKTNYAFVPSADLLLGCWIHYVLTPLFLLLYSLPCLIRQYEY